MCDPNADKIALNYATHDANYFIENCLIKTTNTPQNIYQKRCRTIEKLKDFIERVNKKEQHIRWQEFEFYQQLDHEEFYKYIEKVYSGNKLNEIISAMVKLYLSLFFIDAKRIWLSGGNPSNRDPAELEIKPFALHKKTSLSFDYIYGISYSDNFIQQKKSECYKETFPFSDISLIEQIIYIKYQSINPKVFFLNNNYYKCLLNTLLAENPISA